MATGLIKDHRPVVSLPVSLWGTGPLAVAMSIAIAISKTKTEKAPFGGPEGAFWGGGSGGPYPVPPPALPLSREYEPSHKLLELEELKLEVAKEVFMF